MNYERLLVITILFLALFIAYYVVYVRDNKATKVSRKICDLKKFAYEAKSLDELKLAKGMYSELRNEAFVRYHWDELKIISAVISAKVQVIEAYMKPE